MTYTEADPRTQWLADSRLGMFVHYGLYSLAARGEWVRHDEELTGEQYQKYFDHFTADRADPREWVAAAKQAGMRYAVLTTKHHEGFCLWDSALTDYSSAHAPAQRDLVAEFVEACRAAGLRVGLYHSLIDWHHPDFPLDGLHPQWAGPGTPVSGRDGHRYVQYLHGQIDELVSRFRPDIMWFDFSYPDGAERGKGRDFWDSAGIVERIRRADPAILLNNRLDLPGSEDFATPEDVQPAKSGDGLWEACRSLNGSFGYAPQARNCLDAGQAVRLLVDSVSKGGNLLLNVGPNGRGEIDPTARRLLAEVGEWTARHAAAVYGAGESHIPAPSGCHLTRHGRRTFLHVTGAWPAGHLVLPALPRPVRYASFLHDGAEVPFEVVAEGNPVSAPHVVQAGRAGSTVLRLPIVRPDVAVPVVELDFGDQHI
jgi:alpha-L-fucosidase